MEEMVFFHGVSCVLIFSFYLKTGHYVDIYIFYHVGKKRRGEGSRALKDLFLQFCWRSRASLLVQGFPSNEVHVLLDQVVYLVRQLFLYFVYISLFYSFPGVFWDNSLFCFCVVTAQDQPILQVRKIVVKSWDNVWYFCTGLVFHSPQIHMALSFHTLKSSFPCVDTMAWFEKCSLCKVLSLCKRPSALSLDVNFLFLSLLLLHPSPLPPFFASFSTHSLPPWLSFSLSLPDVSVISRLNPRLFCKHCVMFSVSKTSVCFRSWKWTLSSLCVFGHSGEHCWCNRCFLFTLRFCFFLIGYFSDLFSDECSASLPEWRFSCFFSLNSPSLNTTISEYQINHSEVNSAMEI